MITIDRQAIVIVPREPLLDWINRLDPEHPMQMEDIQADPSVYLVGESSDARKMLHRHFREIFDEQLAAWWVQEEDWPPTRDFRTFQRWFSWTAHSIVFDLEPRPIRREAE